jgi:hypothetical protein
MSGNGTSNDYWPPVEAPAAERMRASGKRRREGTHYVRVQLDRRDIEGLIRRKAPETIRAQH